MPIFFSKSERRKYYSRLRIKIYLAVGLIALVALLTIYGLQNLPFLVRLRSPQIQINNESVPIGATAEKFAIWCVTEPERVLGLVCYWIDRNGIAIEPAPDTEGSAIIKVQDSRDLVLTTGVPVLEERFLANTMKILTKAGNLPIRMHKYRFSYQFQELIAVGVGGEKFVFSIRFEPTEKLFASLAEVISKNNLKNFEYIDLTVENRIYLKQR